MITEVPNTASAPSSRQSFLENLARTQEWLNDQDIEYRIIGSVAASSYLDTPGQTSLNFSRTGASTLAERVPDIDLIVPRGRLLEARSYRDSRSDVKLGLALPTRFIDFRPGEQVSYLTHNKRVFPVRTDVFSPVQNEFLDVPITTVSPATLVHTYYSIRERDREHITRLTALAREQAVSEGDGDPYAGFREFSDDWKHHPSFMDLSIQATTHMLEALPPPARNRAFRLALAMASLAQLR